MLLYDQSTTANIDRPFSSKLQTITLQRSQLHAWRNITNGIPCCPIFTNFMQSKASPVEVRIHYHVNDITKKGQRELHLSANISKTFVTKPPSVLLAKSCLVLHGLTVFRSLKMHPIEGDLGCCTENGKSHGNQRKTLETLKQNHQNARRRYTIWDATPNADRKQMVHLPELSMCCQSQTLFVWMFWWSTAFAIIAINRSSSVALIQQWSATADSN